MKKLTKKQIGLIVVGLVATVSICGTFAYAQYTNYAKTESIKKELKTATNGFTELDKELAKLQDAEDPDYLAKDVTDEKINEVQNQYKDTVFMNVVNPAVKNELDAYNKQFTETGSRLSKVKKAFDTQTDINALYQKNDGSTAINGKDVNDNLVIIDDLSQESVQDVKERYYKDNAISNYDKTINDLVQNAEDQVNQIITAKEEVSKVYKDGGVISTDTAIYDTAKSATDKIKNEKAKKELNDQLDKVKTEIDKKAKEEAEKISQSSDSQEVSQADGVKKNNVTANTPTAEGTATANTGNNATTDNGYSGSNGGGYTPPTANNGGSTGGGSSNTPSGNGSSGGSTGSGTNAGGSSGGSTAAPTTQQYVGWWNDGVMLHSAGTFSTEAEALAAAKSLYIQNGRVGTYGASRA